MSKDDRVDALLHRPGLQADFIRQYQQHDPSLQQRVAQKDRVERQAELLRQYSAGPSITGTHYNHIICDDAGPYKLKLPMNKLQRLATHNDWTIYIMKGPGHVTGGSFTFGAFDSQNNNITSQEGKLVLDGTAFCYKDGRLFSGVITHTPSEQEVRDAAAREKREKAEKHNAKVAARIAKLERLYK